MVHCLTAHILVLTVSARTALSQPVVDIQLQMWSAMGACIQASVFVHVLHVSHSAGSFGSSPSLHLHAPYLSVLLLTCVVVVGCVSKLCVTRKCAMQRGD